jgi:hypothetical protein
MENRATEIVSLNERISKFKGHLAQLQEKELETLRPIMDQRHAKMCEIQQKWPAYG